MSTLEETFAKLEARMDATRSRAARSIATPVAPAAPSRGDQTTAAARQIIEDERRHRAEATARLREQRIARDKAGSAEKG
ncbi:hypothetical protein [Roseivivax sp. CAU 1761]